MKFLTIALVGILAAGGCNELTPHNHDWSEVPPYEKIPPTPITVMGEAKCYPDTVGDDVVLIKKVYFAKVMSFSVVDIHTTGVLRFGRGYGLTDRRSTHGDTLSSSCSRGSATIKGFVTYQPGFVPPRLP